MATTTITPGAIKTGPGVLYYAPLGTTIPTPSVTASKLSATWTSWVQVGATDAGMTYTENIDTESIKVAESQYPIRVVTTAKTGTVKTALAQITDANWKLATNGGTLTSTGATTTKMNAFVPPLVGSEVRVMLGWVSLDDDEIIVWPQVFNTGSLEITRGKLSDMATIPLEFSVEISSIQATPYTRWTSGALATL